MKRSTTALIVGIIIVLIVVASVLTYYYYYLPSQPKKLDAVTLVTDFSPNGYYGPLYYGLDHGIFSQYGIDLQISFGTGSANAANEVVTGKAMFAMPDASVGSGLIAKGANITYVAMVFQTLPQGVFSWGQIKTPQDMAGKTIYVVAGGADSLELPALAAAAGVNYSSINVAHIAASAKYASFAAHQIDNVLAYSWLEYPLLTPAQRQQVTFLDPQKDFHLQIYSNGLVTSTTLIQQNPDLVKRFVQAFAASYTQGIQNINGSISSLLSHIPTLNQTVARLQLMGAIPYMQSADTQAHGFGWMTSSAWNSTENINTKYYGQAQSVPLDKLFTTQFLTGQALPTVTPPSQSINIQAASVDVVSDA